MREPKEYVDEIESAAVLPEGEGERFNGYAVIGLPFDSGHVLALRRFPASSIGPGYTSVWHRDAEGKWTFYQDAPPELACSRYFGNEIDETVRQPISVGWNGPRSFTVSSVGERSVEWSVAVRETLAARAMNAAGGVMPRSWWKRRSVLSLMGAAARAGLGTGSLRLTGRMPNGQVYVANPTLVWLVGDSRAVVGGRDLGVPRPLPVQARLGDFLIPQRGVFAVASAYLERFDPARHLAATSRLAT
jgi:hypothetical protein